MKMYRQADLDHNRKTYVITFPSDVSEQDIIAWLTAISDSLDNGWKRIGGVRSVAFETWATDTGITHRMKVPWQWAADIANQLHGAIPGINIAEDTERPRIKWTRAMQLAMRHPGRTMRIRDHSNLSSSVLRSLGQLEPGEAVLVQWVVTTAPQERPPARDLHSRSTDFTYKALYQGVKQADHDEIEDRRRKLEDLNFQAVGRIAAFTNTEPRAKHLIDRVWSKLHATRSNYNKFVHQPVRSSTLVRNINEAAAPAFFPSQFTMSELAAVLGWPIGQSYVPGMPQSPALQLPATEDIPRNEIVLGNSNYYGNERPVALHFSEGAKHIFIDGKPGSGKSTMMGNIFYQVTNAGHGAFVIDANDSSSNESMFSRALSLIPRHRLKDVVIIDASNISERPVGFNILDQGNPRTVVDQVVSLFEHLFPGQSSIWARQLLFHGLHTLIATPGTTLMDLIPLVNPVTESEKEWAKNIQDAVKDPDMKDFWHRWNKYEKTKQQQNVEPLLNRIWEIASRPELRNILGQPKSSFQMADLVRENKILLVSMRGAGGEGGDTLATFLLQALWTAAQREQQDGYNYLFLDEVQLLEKLPISVRDMLARARQLNFGLVLATQFLGQLSNELRSAALNNTGTRVIFEVAGEEATTWAKEFGREVVKPEHLQFIPKHKAVAQIATKTGGRLPVTLHAHAPFPSTGVASQAIQYSAQQHGRPRDAVERMMRERTTSKKKRTRRPTVGRRKVEPTA